MEDYVDFVDRMGSFDMDLSLDDGPDDVDPKLEHKDDTLEHYGIKGMRWGVRRKTNSDGVVVNSDKKEKKTRHKATPLDKAKSAGRELGQVAKLTKLESMPDEELKKVTDRLRNENEFQRLTRTKGATPYQRSKRAEYNKRDKLSDEELASRVNRLRSEDLLRTEIKKANHGKIDGVNGILEGSSKVLVGQKVDDNWKPSKNSIVTNEVVKGATNLMAQKVGKKEITPTKNPLLNTAAKSMVEQLASGTKIIKK